MSLELTLVDTGYGGMNSVTYGYNTNGIGLFVAVGYYGQVMTSSDGINWNSQDIIGDNIWTSVIYGNDLFVAVSDYVDGSGNVMTSSDGENWTLQSSPNQYWTSVTYGNDVGLFVAVSDYDNGAGSGNVMTSSDGITWTLQSSPNHSWTSVTYGYDNNDEKYKFVAVSKDGNVMKSSDGIDWTLESAYNHTWTSVTNGYDANDEKYLFVAVSEDGNVMTSPDGKNWTKRDCPSYQWTSVTNGPELFVAVSFDGNVMTSPDGKTWTLQTSPSDEWTSVAYGYDARGNGLFVTVGNSTAVMILSYSPPFPLNITNSTELLTFMNSSFKNCIIKNPIEINDSDALVASDSAKTLITDRIKHFLFIVTHVTVG